MGALRSLAISGSFALVAAIAAPLYIRSVVPTYAPPVKGPNVVDAGEAFCLVNHRTRADAVIVEAGTREPLYRIQNGQRKDDRFIGEALDMSSNQVSGTFSIDFDKNGHSVKCTKDEKIYIISWRGGFNFDAR